MYQLGSKLNFCKRRHIVVGVMIKITMFILLLLLLVGGAGGPDVVVVAVLVFVMAVKTL